LVGLAAIAALTAYRILMLPLATAEIFVDEAQYWLWGQELAFGYFSKPPLIGWVIRASTELAGSDGVFWIRLPGPLFHAATALVLMRAARRLMDPVSAVWCGIVYATMPAVGLASILISTDTILLLFFAGAIWIYVALRDRSSVGLALALGVCLGLGMMAKYAALYFAVCAGIAAVLVPQARIAWRDVGIAAVAFLMVVSANIIWNLENDLVTVSHTADNVDWVKSPGISLNWSKVVEFVGSQFAVLGPVFFGAYLVLIWRVIRSEDWTRRWLLWMSLPILLLMIGQALLSRAYGNWAVTAYPAAILLIVPVLWWKARPVFWTGLAVNLALVVALPVVATQVTEWRAGEEDRLLLRRYVGREALSARIFEEARARSAVDVVAWDRDVLSDLFYRAPGVGDLEVFAAPVDGYVPHYYAQKHTYPEGRSGPVMFFTFGRDVPDCAAEVPDVSWAVTEGAYRGREMKGYLVPSACWATRFGS